MEVSSLTLLNQDVNGSMLTLEPTWAGFRDSRIAQWTGRPIPPMYGEVVLGTTLNWYMDAKGMNDFIATSYKTLLSKKEYIREVKEHTYSLSRTIFEYARTVFIPSREADVLKTSRDYLYEISTWGLVVAFADINGDITNRNLQILQSKLGDDHGRIHAYSRKLSTPPLSLTEKAVLDIRNRTKPDTTLLKEYFWLNQGYAGRGLTKVELELLQDSKDREIGDRSNSELPDLVLSDKEQYSFGLARDMVEVKALRADTRQALNVVLNRTIDLLAKKWNTASDYLSVMTVSELLDSLRSDKLPDNLKERYEYSLWIADENHYTIHTGKEAKRILSGRLATSSELTKAKELKGQIAYPGKVQGIVRLVFGPQHNNKVQDTDVLVSLTTSPQLLPAMIRAKAFVTAIGGITSHAAIVAREMKKPCIVGIKGITDFLKDGDLVEVDADKGVITVL